MFILIIKINNISNLSIYQSLFYDYFPFKCTDIELFILPHLHPLLCPKIELWTCDYNHNTHGQKYKKLSWKKIS
jgi:hypothetical protein